MDYDNDGKTDILTGSYTGQLYLFRRTQDGEFGKRELLLNKAGKTIRVPDYSVTPELADIDDDGDLDLVIGTRSGPINLIVNVGTRSAPVWAETFGELKTVNGAIIKGSNAHHADWDGDGIRDLVVGSERGPVVWHRNRGTDSTPAYENSRELTKRSSGPRGTEGTEPNGPGSRLKVHVADWNGDGRVDLLVGDVTWQQSSLKPLTADEDREKAKVEPVYKKLNREQNDAAVKLMQLRTAKQPIPASLQRRLDTLTEKIAPYRKKMARFRRTKMHTHGWVWLYLRKAKSADGSGR